MAPHMTDSLEPQSLTTTPSTSTTTTTTPSKTAPITGLSARLSCRAKTHKTPTSGLAPTYIQANLLILPSIHASSFRLLCKRNPVPCPLLAESVPGSPNALISHLPGMTGSQIASNLDLRLDAPKYNVYKDGKLVKKAVDDVREEWTDDHVAFVIGCSFSFETALVEGGLTPRHIEMERNVCMYRTNIPLCPAGVFKTSTYVVSMRSYPASAIERVRDITRPYIATHGEPVAWGWNAVKELGIQSLDRPDWGDAPLTLDGKPLGEMEGDEEQIPVFWGCGVTPQEAVMRAGLEGTVMAHAPGYMLVLDIRDWDIVPKVDE